MAERLGVDLIDRVRELVRGPRPTTRGDLRTFTTPTFASR
jgi:hypothetical protein